MNRFEIEMLNRYQVELENLENRLINKHGRTARHDKQVRTARAYRQHVRELRQETLAYGK